MILLFFCFLTTYIIDLKASIWYELCKHYYT